jgi:hypothetical protein
MSKQPEALRLAGVLYDDGEVPSLDECSAAAAELRRQHALIAELRDALKRLEGWVRCAADEGGDFNWYAINADEGELARAAISKADQEEA